MAKAQECVSKGDPTLLAVMDATGATTFSQLEDGKFKRPGKNWLAYIGQRVEITGPARTKKEKHFIRVDALYVLSSPEVTTAPQANR